MDVEIIFEGDNIVQYKVNDKLSGRDTSQPASPQTSQSVPTVQEGEKLVTVHHVAPPKEEVPQPTSDQIPESPSVSEKVEPLRHQLDQKNYAYPVFIGVKSDSGTDDYYERKLTFNDAKECHVELQDGETYRIYFKNNTTETVCLRVFVDGLNTLSQDIHGVYQFAPRLPLEAARHYVVEGNELVMIQGFFGEWEFLSDTDKKQLNDSEQNLTKGAFYRSFIVSRSNDSLAAKKGNAAEVGTITVAVYRYETKKKEYLAVDDKGRTRGRNSRLGTSSGQTTQSKADYAEAGEVGHRIDMYHIFY